MQTYQPDFKELLHTHSAPPVVVRITYYESGKKIKEINRQVAVRRGMVAHNRKVCFKQMIYDYHDGSRTS